MLKRFFLFFLFLLGFFKAGFTLAVKEMPLLTKKEKNALETTVFSLPQKIKLNQNAKAQAHKKTLKKVNQKARGIDSVLPQNRLLEDLVDLKSGQILLQNMCHQIEGPASLAFNTFYTRKGWDLRLKTLAVQNLDKSQIILCDGKCQLVFSSPQVEEKTVEESHWWTTSKKKKQLKAALKQQTASLEQFYHLQLLQANGLDGIDYSQHDYAGRVDGKKETLEIITPEGRQLFYKAALKATNKELKELLTDEVSYLLEKEIEPNGNVLVYDYDDRKRLSSIRALGPKENKVFSWLRFTYYNPYLLDADFDVYASDGTLLQVRLEKVKKQVFLKRLISSRGKEESYEYFSQNKQSLFKQIDFKGKTYKFEYYPAQCGKASQVKTILMQTEESVFFPLYKFIYGEGRTEIINALGQKNIYFYNEQGQICKFESYTIQGELVFLDRFIYSGKGKLLCKYRLDFNRQAFGARVYTYDERGNLLEEKWIGNLSGAANKPLQFKADGMPIEKETEVFSKTYQYDDENQKTLETDGSLQIEYSYAQGRLVRKRLFEKANPAGLSKRFFYKYNDEGLLIEKIIDDGKTALKDDLTGVTERKIKRFILKEEEPFYGRVVSIEKFYLDLSSQEEKLVKKTVFTYSAKGLVEKENYFGPKQNLIYSIEKKYDQYGNVIFEKKPGKEKNLFYNGQGRLVKKEKAQGRFEYSYDFNGRLIGFSFLGKDGLKVQRKRTYDLLGRLLEEEDRFQNKTSYFYDDFGRRIRKVLPSCLNEEGEEQDIVCKQELDVFDREIYKEDPIKRKTFKFYNMRGQLVKIIYPDQTEQQFLYNLDGTLKEKIDQTGIKTCYFYDFFKRKIKAEVFLQDKLLFTKKKTFNSFHLVNKTDAMDRKTEFYWDYAGRLAKEKNKGLEIEYFYDSLGQVFQKKINNGKNSYFHEFKRDQAGLIEEKKTDLSGQVLSLKKYVKNQDLEKVAADGFEEKKVYDSLGRVVKWENSLEGKKEYTYKDDFQNVLGQNVLQVEILEKGQKKTKTYDALFRMVETEVKEPLYKEELVYNLASFLRKKTKISFTGKEPLLEEHFYEYDLAGNLVYEKIALPFSEHAYIFEYNHAGKQTKRTAPDGSWIKIGYSPLGYMESLKSSDSKIDYTFKHNASGELLEAVDIVNEKKTVLKRNEFGFAINEKLANGLQLDKSVDFLGRLEKVVLPDSTELYLQWGPLYLENTLRKEKLETGLLFYKRQFSQFDGFGRAQKTVFLGDLDDLAYEFDLSGQKINVHAFGFYQPLDLAEKEGQTSKNLDINGRILSKETEEGIVQYEYDALGRKVSEKNGAHQIVYTYDALDRRMEKLVYLKAASGDILKEKQLYLYDGQKEIGLWKMDEKFLQLKVKGDLIQQDFKVAIEN